MVALVEEEAKTDASFKEQLEELVIALQNLEENAPRDAVSYKDVGSVANVNVKSASNSNVSGRDTIADNQISGGQNVVGGTHQGSTFR